MRNHDRKSFYKYMPASTAKIVLASHTLRWSSPVIFNDPFDVPRELACDIDPSDIKAAISEIMEESLINDDADISWMKPILKYLLIQTRKGENQLKNNLITSFRKQATADSYYSGGLEEIKDLWRTKFLPNSRILCLSAAKDITPMWYHYADQYRGVVLELACSDELDPPWLLARPVEYPEKLPELFSAKGWAWLMMSSIQNHPEHILNVYTYNKTPHWEYEQEWRILSFKRPGETGFYSDYRLDPRWFLRIYFGPMIAPDDRRELLTLISKEHQHIQPYEVSFGLDRKIKIHACRKLIYRQTKHTHPRYQARHFPELQRRREAEAGLTARRGR